MLGKLMIMRVIVLLFIQNISKLIVLYVYDVPMLK